MAVITRCRKYVKRALPPFWPRLLYPQGMAIHIRISPEETADRLALRELEDAYAYCADRRDAKG